MISIARIASITARPASTAARSASRSLHTVGNIPSVTSARFPNGVRSKQISTRSTTVGGMTAPMLRGIRCYSGSGFSSSGQQPGRFRLGQALRNMPMAAVGLILGGITLTLAGLWQFYTSGVNAFPEAIRNDLRKALYYQNYGDDPEKAVGFYRTALNAAMQHPDLEVDGPEVTGIMIQMGGLFQDLGRTREAIEVLQLAFEALVHGRTMGKGNEEAVQLKGQAEQAQGDDGQHLDDLSSGEEPSLQQQQENPKELKKKHYGPSFMDGPTRLKTVGVAQKLGDLYHAIKMDEQAERYYLWSVEQLLKNHDELREQTHGNSEEERLRHARDQEQVRKGFNFEKLPSWMNKTDLGASLEALGGFYTSKRIYSNALPLYMRALSLVDANSCHAAVLMCNISDAFAGLGQVEDATGWAERGLKVGSAQNGQECDEGCGVLLYNLGMLHEMKGDILKAQDYYKQSKQHGLKTGFNQCITESNKALRRIKESNEGTQ
ncbi:hypothetical protein EDD11_003603 [Mortierella claussenii]|nr:hypothetical protein EDD11_003603 [Mortierella claussenii]